MTMVRAIDVSIHAEFYKIRIHILIFKKCRKRETFFKNKKFLT